MDYTNQDTENETPLTYSEEEIPSAETEEETPQAAAQEETPLDTPSSPEDLEPLRETGHVKWFNDVRSYGFIEREGADDIFVHASNINRQPQSLSENDLVEFTIVNTDKGLSAEDVTVLREAPRS